MIPPLLREELTGVGKLTRIYSANVCRSRVSPTALEAEIVAHRLLNRPLNVLLAGLTLLTPVTIHLFFPVIPAVKADFGLSDALAQLTFSVGVFALAFSTLI